MSQVVVGGLTGLVSGALYGAIGAGVAQASSSAPVLKGAAVGGLVAGTIATAVFAARAQNAAEGQLQTGTSAPQEIYFP